VPKKKKTPKSKPIYQLKIILADIDPPIWRRVQVRENTTLKKLHLIIQAAMGWENDHMHQFEIDGVEYGEPVPGDMYYVEDEAKVTLKTVAPKSRKRFQYEYDFGDSWVHDIKVEKILPLDPEVKYPLLLEGERACPPEDVGGVWGYEEFLEAIGDPKHSEHDEYLEWVGEDFDPEVFDIEKINLWLKKIK